MKLVRATYRQTPPTILGIKEPIALTQLSFSNVPKVIILVARDASGKSQRFDWFLDKGIQNRVYDRMDWFPTDSAIDGSYRLALRGPEEAALYGLLLRYAAAQEKKADLSTFERQTLKSVNTLLEKLDERFAGEKPVLQK